MIDVQGNNDLVETGGTIASATGQVGNGRDIEAADTRIGQTAVHNLPPADGEELTWDDVGV